MGYNETVNLQINAIGNFSNVVGEVSKLQSRLQSLKLPKNLGGDAAKGLSELQEKFTNLQNLANRGIRTKADFNNFERSAKEVDVALKQVEKSLNGISNKKIRLNITDSDEIKKKIQELERFKKEAADAMNLKNLGTANASGIFNISKINEIASSLSKSSVGAKNLQNVLNSFKSGNIDQVSSALQKLVTYANKYEKTLNDSGGNQRGTQLLAWAREAQAAISGADAKIDEFNADIERMRADQFNKLASGAESFKSQFSGVSSAIRQSAQEMRNMAKSTMDTHSQLNMLQTQANYFFGLQNMFQLFKRNIMDTFDTVKQLDKAMTETAVVTDYSVSDMWGKLPLYTKTANELGATIKGAYETMTLYYQQGLNTEEAFAVGTETMKMARIAGLDYAQTTNMMTAALRGFNMEINNTSAKRVNDVYSKLAAVTASDTRELGLAMERTASIAHSANMDFGNTTAFLAQMIETTREAPENLGTAMKTIIARFQELKENPYQISEVEGEEVDFNRVDKALKTIGVDLMDNRDKFRDLDDVFMDISERWDGLSQTQQRYIATIAAGARQQSRFLAMVGNYDRLKQLTDAAANSEGAADVQFAKTLDSMEAKLNKLRNAWDQFAMGIANNQLLKGAVDFGVKALDTINKIENKIQDLAGGFGTLGGSVAKSITSLTALWAAFKIGGKIVDTSIGLLGGFLGVTKVKGAGLLGGISGQRAAASAAQASAIYTPIVNAINNAAARVTNTQIKTSQGLKNGNLKNSYRDFRNTQDKLRFTYQYGKSKKDVIPKTFTGKDVASELKNYSAEQQRVLLKQVPGTRSALERSYKDATKKLNLSESSANVVNQLRGQISKEMMKPGGSISPEAGIHLLGNPKQLANFVEDEAVRKELLKGVRNNRKELLKEAQAKGIGRDKTGAERNRALKEYVRKREEQIYNPNARLTKEEMTTNKISGMTSAATAAGQAVMNLGMALDGLGLHGAGGALTSIGSTMTSFGLAASGAVEGVTALKTALSGMGVALGPLAAVSAGIVLLGVAAGVAYKKQQDHIKEIRKEGKEIATNYNDAIEQTTSNLAKLNDYRTNFAKLAQGVDANGNNINLGAEEYSDYLKMVKEITDMHPELIKGYSAQGNIIVDNNNIIKDAIKLEQKQQEEAKKTFITQESLNKMAMARQTTKRWQVGQMSADRTIVTGKNASTIKGSSQLRNDSQKIIDDIKQLENGEQILNDLAKTYHLTAADFENLNTEALLAIESSGGDMINYIKKQAGEGSEELLDTINDDIAKVGKDFSGMREVSNDIVDSLLLYAGEKGYTDKIHSTLQGTFTDAVKNIALFEDPENMQSAVDSVGKEFSTLGGHLEEYNNILDTVEEAQTQFGKDLDLNKYNTSISDSIQQLEEWKSAWDEGTDSTSKTLSEWAENQIATFKNVSNGTVELADAFNTMSGRIASANSSYENWTKQNEEGDLYTASDNFKKMLEEVNDDVDNLGKGSQQWWTAAQSMFGDEYVLEHSKKQIQSHMNQVKDYLKEGQEGVDNFMIDLRDNKLGKELDKDILGVKKNGAPYTIGDFIKVDKNGGLNFDKLGEAPDEAFSAIAKSLGLSDDLLTSLMNKARQFGDIKFGNVDQMRTALATSESTIVGSGSTNGNKNIYVKETDFTTQALDAGLRGDEVKEYKKQLENLGTIFMESASSINKGELSKYIKDWGISTGGYKTDKGKDRFQTTADAFIRYLDKANYNKDEIQQMYETATNGKNSLITDADKVDFNEAYQTAKEANADPSFQAINSIEGNVSGILGITQSIATAMGILTQDTKNQVDEKTEATNNHAEDLINGNPDVSYEKARATLEEDVASLKETKAVFEQGQANYEEGTAGWLQFQTRIDAINSSLNTAEAALNTTTKSQYEAAQVTTEIANFAKGPGGQEALKYYNQNGFGNTDLQSRNSNLINWGEDPTKNSNWKNLNTWGKQDKNEWANSYASYWSRGDHFGSEEKGKGAALSFTPILQKDDGSLKVLAKENVEAYLDAITQAASDNEGNVDISKLMKLDEQGFQDYADEEGNKLHGLLLGAFAGQEGEASGALGELEHILSEGMTASDTSFGGLKEAAEDANTLAQNLSSTGIQGQQAADELTTSFLRLNQEGLSKLSDEEFNSVITGLGKTRGEVEAIASSDPTINLGIESDTTQLDETTDQINTEESTEHEIPVEVQVQNEGGQTAGGLINQATDEAKNAASQTITTPFTLNPVIENPEAVNAKGIKEKAGVPDSLPSQTITANYTLKANVDSTGAKQALQKKAKLSGKGISGGTVTTKATMNSSSFDATAKKVESKAKTLDSKTIKPKISASDNASSTINSVSSKLTKLDGKTANTKIVTTKIERKAAKGMNNHISHRSVPHAGSAAKGSRHGTVGPKDKGGLTLTGEKGFEIAWIPSENRSMILGANGPQMINLPNDAVVWTNEQSKKILKQKAIPAGSHGNPSGTYVPGSSSTTTTTTTTTTSSGNSSKGNDRRSDNNKKVKEYTRELQKQGSVNSKIFNLEQKIAQVKRKQAEEQKKLNKLLKDASSTLQSIAKAAGEKDIKYLNKLISLNKKLASIYQSRLTRAEADDSRSKTTIKWTRKTQKKKGKNGKWKKGKDKKKKASINIGNYIKPDETGAYVVDYAKITKDIGKDHKNKKGKKVKGDKAKAKAVQEAAEKAISENTSKRDSALDAVNDAKDKLEELGQQLYDTFYGWKNELTKIYVLSKKISDTEKTISGLKEAQSLREAMIASGLSKHLSETSQAFINSGMDLFRNQLSSTLKELRQKSQAITLQREDIAGISTGSKVRDSLTITNTILDVNDLPGQIKEAKAKVSADKKVISARDTLSKKTTSAKETTKAKKASDKIASDNKKIKDAKKAKKKAKSKKAANKADRKIKKLKKDKKKQTTKRNKARANIKTFKAGATADKKLKTDQAKVNNLNDQLNKARATAERLGIQTSGFTETKLLALQARQDALREQQAIVNKAQEFTSVKTNKDGTVEIDFNSEALESQKEADPINEKMYQGIKDYFDSLNESNEELKNLIESSYSILGESYKDLADLKENYADYSEELLDATEKAQEAEIDKLENLSKSLSDALKNLLDEVKNRLEERRQQEDNAEKEQDISQKQNRLAALRADSSGANAKEIKQLEKEIADAQKSYGRELEDQQLQRLQDQADKAAEQRERQIQLLRDQLEVDKANGSNLETVNRLLAKIKSDDPEVVQKALLEIEKLWKANKEYDEQTLQRQAVLDSEWETFRSNLLLFPEKIAEQMKAIETENEEINTLKNIQEWENRGALTLEGQKFLDKIDSNGSWTASEAKDVGVGLRQIIDLLKAKDTSDEKIGQALKDAGFDYQSAKESRMNDGDAIKYGLTSVEELVTTFGKDLEKLVKNGVSAKQLVDSQKFERKDILNQDFDASQLREAGYTVDELGRKFNAQALKQGGYTVKDFKDAGEPNKTIFDTFSLKEIKKSGLYSLQQLKDSGKYTDSQLKDAGFTASDFKGANYNYSDVKGLFGTKELANAGYQEAKNIVNAQAAQAAYDDFLYKRGNKKSKDKNKGKIGKDEYTTQVKRGAILGKSEYKVASELAATDELTWTEVIKAAKEAGRSGKTIKSWNPKAKKDSSFRKAFDKVFTKGWSKYASGGLASYTGPAWLDGTPSKPELVLNAQDTKNFLGLRDVLQKAVGSANSVTNSTETAMYEININVDHINNDYDVDKIASRIKKDIIKDAGYRNVTQVRKFR